MAEVKKIIVGSQQKYLRTVDNKGNQNIILRPENLQLQGNEDNLADDQAFMGYFFAFTTPLSGYTFTSTITIDFTSKPFYGFAEQLTIVMRCARLGTGSGYWMLSALLTYGDKQLDLISHNGISSIYIGVDTQFNLIFKWIGTPEGMDTTADGSKIIIMERADNRFIEQLADGSIVSAGSVTGWGTIVSQASPDDRFQLTAGTGYVYQEGLQDN